MEEVRTWRACSRSLKKGNGLKQPSDAKLLCARKVAECLQDKEMEEAVLDELAEIVGQAAEDANLEPAREDEMRAQVVKVLEAMPQRAVLRLFRILERRPTPEHATWPGDANMLLHLLPRHFHPAFVEAFYTFLEQSDEAMPQCVIETDAWQAPHNNATAAPQPPPERSTDAQSRDAARTTATTAFQMLAAAAPLAGGSFDLAWAAPRPPARSGFKAAMRLRRARMPSAPPDDITELFAEDFMGLPDPPEGTPPEDAPPDVGEEDDSLQRLSRLLTATGSCEPELQRLTVLFDIQNVQVMPSRWCVALAQLVMLQDLRVEICADHVDSKFEFCTREFAAALVSLPALWNLEISFDVNRGGRQFEPDVVRITSPCTVPLFACVAAMPQLERVHLAGCADVHVSTLAAVRTARVAGVFSRLPRLVNLTTLVLEFSMLFGGTGAQYGSDWAAALGSGLRRLPALESLWVDMEVCGVVADIYSTPVAAPDEFILELFSEPGLPALVELRLGLKRAPWMFGQDDPEWLPATLFKRLAAAVRLHHAALQTRLTSLTLRDFTFEPGSHDAAMVASVIAGMTALQSLDLRSVDLGDEGLRALAWVGPRLQGLTKLDIFKTGGNPAGVFGLLSTLLASGHALPSQLESLNVGCSCDMRRPDRARELARLLGQFVRLKCLGISVLGLGCVGLWEVAKTLTRLPHLQLVDARGNAPSRPGMDEDAALEMFRGGVAAHLPGVSFMLSERDRGLRPDLVKFEDGSGKH